MDKPIKITLKPISYPPKILIAWKEAIGGNKKIREDAMRSEIKLKSRNVYQKSDVQDTIELIRDLYKRSGYFSAKIKTRIIFETDLNSIKFNEYQILDLNFK